MLYTFSPNLIIKMPSTPKLDPDVEKRLYYALRDGKLDEVRDCINNHGIDANLFEPNPLYIASQYGHLDIVRYLVQECHVDIDSRSCGNTAVHTACEHLKLSTVRYLARECHAKLEQFKDSYGNCVIRPLVFSAIDMNDLEMIQFIIQDFQLDVNTIAYYGCTFLHYVLRKKYPRWPIIKYLIQQCHADVEMLVDDSVGSSN
jgi:hypothetical protein